MSRGQWFVLIFAVANLALVLLFPPYDYASLQRANIPTFDGFHFVFTARPNRVLNSNFLALEVIVVLINAAIAWLLQRKPTQPMVRKGNRYQRGVLWFVALNLVFLLLFPPFENYQAITKAALPSFEGFYFLFGDNGLRQIVTPILYIEVALLLINGCLLWLLFKDRGIEDMSDEELKRLAGTLRNTRRK